MKTNPELRSLWAMAHDGDPYGQAMSMWFGASNVLYHENEEIPLAWHYQNGGLQRDACLDYPDAEILGLYRENYVSADDLRHFGNVLQRIVSLCETQGIDY